MTNPTVSAQKITSEVRSVSENKAKKFIDYIYLLGVARSGRSLSIHIYRYKFAGYQQGFHTRTNSREP